MSEMDRDLRVVIVDDEPPARDLLDQYLETHSGFEVVSRCANGFEAVKAVEELSPDILLLDVQMPKLDGFEVLELLEAPPQVIFTTAHDEYALQAFEVQAADYLLKPFSAQRLYDALDRARRRIAEGRSQPLDELRQRRRAESSPVSRLLVKEGPRVHVLPLAEVDYIESRNDYVEIHCAGTSYRKKQTLGELEAVTGADFVRIHRCYLLNLDRLRRIEPYAKDSRVAFLEDGRRLPVSRSGYARLRELL